MMLGASDVDMFGPQRQIMKAEERSVWRGGASGEQRKEDMEDAVQTMRAEREQLLCGLCYNRQREVISSEKTSCILCY